MVKTQASNIQLQAFWGNGGWKQTIGNVYSQLGKKGNMDVLGLRTGDLSESNQSYIAEEFFALDLLTAAGRITSMAVWSELPPWMWAGLLDADPSLVQAKRNELIEFFQILMAALKVGKLALIEQASPGMVH